MEQGLSVPRHGAAATNAEGQLLKLWVEASLGQGPGGTLAAGPGGTYPLAAGTAPDSAAEALGSAGSAVTPLQGAGAIPPRAPGA